MTDSEELGSAYTIKKQIEETLRSLSACQKQEIELDAERTQLKEEKRKAIREHEARIQAWREREAEIDEEEDETELKRQNLRAKLKRLRELEDAEEENQKLLVSNDEASDEDHEDHEDEDEDEDEGPIVVKPLRLQTQNATPVSNKKSPKSAKRVVSDDESTDDETNTSFVKQQKKKNNGYVPVERVENFPNLVKHNGKWVQLKCCFCGATAAVPATRKFFDGLRGIKVHLRTHHKYEKIDGRTLISYAKDKASQRIITNMVFRKCAFPVEFDANGVPINVEMTFMNDGGKKSTAAAAVKADLDSDDEFMDDAEAVTTNQFEQTPNVSATKASTSKFSTPITASPNQSKQSFIALNVSTPDIPLSESALSGASAGMKRPAADPATNPPAKKRAKRTGTWTYTDQRANGEIEFDNLVAQAAQSAHRGRSLRGRVTNTTANNSSANALRHDSTQSFRSEDLSENISITTTDTSYQSASFVSSAPGSAVQPASRRSTDIEVSKKADKKEASNVHVDSASYSAADGQRDFLRFPLTSFGPISLPKTDVIDTAVSSTQTSPVTAGDSKQIENSSSPVDNATTGAYLSPETSAMGPLTQGPATPPAEDVHPHLPMPIAPQANMMRYPDSGAKSPNTLTQTKSITANTPQLRVATQFTSKIDKSSTTPTGTPPPQTFKGRRQSLAGDKKHSSSVRKRSAQNNNGKKRRRSAIKKDSPADTLQSPAASEATERVSDPYIGTQFENLCPCTVTGHECRIKGMDKCGAVEVCTQLDHTKYCMEVIAHIVTHTVKQSCPSVSAGKQCTDQGCTLGHDFPEMRHAIAQHDCTNHMGANNDGHVTDDEEEI